MKNKITCSVCNKEIFALGIASHRKLHEQKIEKQLVPGDVVMLKSGGPKMTLNIIAGQNNENYWVRYFEDGLWKEVCFHKHELKKV